MKLPSTTVPITAARLPAIARLAAPNSVSRSGRRAGTGGCAASPPTRAWRCAATCSIQTDSPAGNSSTRPTTAPRPNFICPLTWL